MDDLENPSIVINEHLEDVTNEDEDVELSNLNTGGEGSDESGKEEETPLEDNG